MIQRLLIRSRVVQLVVTSIAALALVLVGTTSAFAWGGDTSANALLRHSPAGTAYLKLDSSGYKLTVTITLSGLAPNSTHPAHIHAGSNCAANGPIIYMLNDVVANDKGQAYDVTVVNLSSPGIPNNAWYINVHNGPTLATPAQAEAIACGPISNPYGASMVKTNMGPTLDPNQNATGYTHLYLKDGNLVVWIKVYGLVPYSRHAAHVHAGNCYATGGVLYNLSPLVANKDGIAEKTVVFYNVGLSSIPEHAWDVNVHFSTNLSTQTGYDPILCGNVVD